MKKFTHHCVRWGAPYPLIKNLFSEKLMGAVVAREGVEPHDSHTDSQSVGYGLTKLNDSGDEGMGAASLELILWNFHTHLHPPMQ